jgi:hypothetical protein
MNHIKQIGGSRKIRGTSIGKEVTKASLKLVLVVALIIGYKRNRTAVSGYASTILTSAVSAFRKGFAQARGMFLK